MPRRAKDVEPDRLLAETLQVMRGQVRRLKCKAKDDGGICDACKQHGGLNKDELNILIAMANSLRAIKEGSERSAERFAKALNDMELEEAMRDAG